MTLFDCSEVAAKSSSRRSAPKLISTSKSYKDLLARLKSQIRSAQVRAAVKVNQELVLFYWGIGKEIWPTNETTPGRRNHRAAACCTITLVPQLRAARQGEGPGRAYLVHAFASSQVPLEVGGEDFKLDLLF